MPKDEEGIIEWRRDWIKRLAKIPHWKLMKLDDFNGPYITDVWKFFDELKQPADTSTGRTEYKQTPREKQIAQDFSEHIKTVLNFQGSREERLKWEIESYRKLDKKWPHLNVWAQVKHEKRFQGLI